jgi:nicotinamidase-related amidase
MAKRAEREHVGQERAPIVLVLIDVVQDFEIEDGALVHARTQAIVPALAALRRRAHAAGVPVVYVNDHFGRWRSTWDASVERAVRSRRGDVAARLRPTARDFFVLKPARSAFHQTPLEALLDTFGAREVVLAGITSDMCVMASASDAMMRGLRVRVPRDTTTTLDDARQERALTLLAESMAVDTRPSSALAWDGKKTRKGTGRSRK